MIPVTVGPSASTSVNDSESALLAVTAVTGAPVTIPDGGSRAGVVAKHHHSVQRATDRLCYLGADGLTVSE